MPYQRLSAREGRSNDSGALHEGVPAWLASTVWDWVDRRLRPFDALGDRNLNVDLLRAIERNARLQLGISPGEYGEYESLERLVRGSSEGLDVLDYLLTCADQRSATELAAALSEGGSAYTVEPQPRPSRGYQLCRRVAPEVRQLVENAMTASDRAGAHLRGGWTAVYGRHPDASAGFREAVRAVEAVACPVVLPKDPKATLGKVIAAIKDAPDKFHLDLSPDGGLDAVGAMRGMCELLWKSQFDRHGTPEESVPIAVSLPEAETAIHLAATLVHWFAKGRVARAEGER